MDSVSPKKNLGQHFLTDENIAKNIVDSLHLHENITVLEIGPGMGVLSKYLISNPHIRFIMMDIDRESIAYLKAHYPKAADNIIYGDFLKADFNEFQLNTFSVIGNFPYNISSQILFKILDHRNQIPEVVGMFQKEVAERVASKSGSKVYGILSVLLQAYYDIEYLFTVDENVFCPPPKVKSAVIRLKRNTVTQLPCNEVRFQKVVKAAFNQRRKTLRNALKNAGFAIDNIQEEYLNKRPEQLNVADFIEITKAIDNAIIG